MKREIKNLLIGLIIGMLISFGGIKISLAESCPQETTVNGPKSITFVGGVIDLGGDTQAYVWFEYGTSSGNYTFKTEKKLVNQVGKYCITVNNLNPCTTYYYRAAMENRAGPSYGAEKSKKTFCTQKVLGTATTAPTGVGTNNLARFLILPLLIALSLTLVFKPHFLKLEEWVDKRKSEYQNYKIEKLLRSKIAQFKTKK